MKKKIFFYLCILLSLKISSQVKHDLVIKPGGHLAMIKEIVTSPDGNYLLSAGDDKTIKVWGKNGYEPLYEILGQTGEGLLGSITSIALSPDGKYLAVVGNFAENLTSLAGSGDIRLYDFKSRKIVKLFKGHTFLCYCVAFSHDGKKLISGSGDKTIKLWDVESGREEKTFTGHEKEVFDLCYAGKEKIISCALDGTVRLWNIKSGKEEKKAALHAGMITKVAATKDGKKLYSGGEDKKIMEYDIDLNLIQEIKSSQVVASMALSPGEKRILIGGWESPFFCEVLSNKSGKWKTISAYGGHDQTVSACTFINDSLVATAGGGNNEVHIWHIEEASGEDIMMIKNAFRMYGNGSKMCAVGFDKNVIGFSDVCKTEYGKGDISYWFDLMTRTIGSLSADEQKSFKGIYTEVNGKKLQHLAGGNYGMPNAILKVTNADNSSFEIKRDEYTGFGHKVYSFSGNGKRIVSGGTGNAIVFNETGDMLGELIGHTGEIISLWVSQDGNKCITGSYDQTIRIWDLSKLNDKPTFSSADIIEPSRKADYKKYFPEINFEEKGGVEKLYYALKNKVGSNWLSWILLEQHKVEPLASIFIGLDNEWVVWCNDGYYSASKKGGKYIGFHINQGSDKEAKFYPFEQFDLKYNRPDIINQRLALGDATLNELLKAAHEKRIKKSGFEEKDLSDELHVPEILLTTQDQDASTEAFYVEWSANDAFYNLDRVNIYVNDVPVFGAKGMSLKEKKLKRIQEKSLVHLLEGNNKVQVSVVNAKGVESLKETIHILLVTKNEKPNLYMVSIGCSEYSDKRFDLKYAHKDAQDVSALFAGNTSLYNKINSKTLTNSQVTLGEIEKLKTFLKEAKPNDVVIVFVAGHGVLDASFDYYFASHNMDFTSPVKFGIPYIMLESLLDGTAAMRKVLFMDTCHSGEVEKEDMQMAANIKTESGDISFRAVGAGVESKSLSLKKTTELMKLFFSDVRKGTGATVISSAGGAEFAQESDQWKNGLFTFCMLDGIVNKKADRNKDGKIYLSELQNYLSYEVTKRSEGKQIPAARAENLELDFRIF